MESSENTSPLLVTAREARRLLGGISHTSLWRLTKDGTLAPVKIGGRTMFRIADIRRLAGLDEEAA